MFKHVVVLSLKVVRRVFTCFVINRSLMLLYHHQLGYVVVKSCILWLLPLINAFHLQKPTGVAHRDSRRSSNGDGPLNLI